jgi:hypothetical protein
VRDPRWPLPGAGARLVEHLVGLQPNTLRAVERRADGAFVLKFKTQRLNGSYPRMLRIPAKKIFGYEQRSPRVRERDLRARHRQNARKFAMWLMWKVGIDAPVVHRVIFERDPAAVDELREAILTLAGPDYVILVWERRPRRSRIPDTFPEEWAA